MNNFVRFSFVQFIFNTLVFAQSEGSSGIMGMDSTVVIATVGTIVGAAIWWYFKSKPSTVAPIKPIVKQAIPPTKSAKKIDTRQSKDDVEYKQKCKIFFGSQTGTAEDFSRKLASEAKKYKIGAQVVDLEMYEPEELSSESFVIFCVATYGEGEPTDNARTFYECIMDESRPKDLLKGVKFTVFGLGNKTYEHYNAIARRFDKRMEDLGGERVFKKGEGDDDSSLEDDFAAWKRELWPELCKKFGIEGINEDDSQEARFKLVWHQEGAIKSFPKFLPKKAGGGLTYDAKNPYISKIATNKELHTEKSDRSCRHVEFEIPRNVNYEPGDHLGIFPENDPKLVEELTVRLGLDPTKIFSLVSLENNRPAVGPCTIRQAFLQWYDITNPPRKSVLKVLTKFATDENEKKKLMELCDESKPEPYASYIKDSFRNVLEILNEFRSINIPFEVLLEALPRLNPRYYSISSSPKAHPGFIHVTAVVVQFKTHTGRLHSGVCSNYLAKLKPGDEIPVFVRKSSFKLPKQPTVPIVMVGPGTGLAPFRGFIHERKIQTTESVNVLFFGCRAPEIDFIYQDELEVFDKHGHLKLHTAFSRHTEKKVYVQHRMQEVEDQLWEVINEKKGHFYICGDARNMEKEVHGTIKGVIKKKLGYNDEQAEQYLNDMKKAGRYSTDTWY